MITVGSLFAGIGGIEKGLEDTGGFVTKWQVEMDDYATQVLEKHWPDVTRWRDVRTFPPPAQSPWLGAAWREKWSVDLICGGFPCQDISYAGKGAGLAGARSGLFFEVVRVARCLRPRWLLLENVAALLSRGLGTVLKELSQIGYVGEWCSMPSGAFGTHFRGDRVYIIASRSATSCLRRQGEWTNPIRAFTRDEFTRLVESTLPTCVPAGKADRISDGVRWRVDRLRCLGNAVVPQVAEYIGRQILNAEDSR